MGIYNPPTPQSIGAVPSSDVQFGVFTPILTDVANIANKTAYQCQFDRVGEFVTVSGKVDIQPSLSGTITSLRMSLPVSSNFSQPENLGGVISTQDIDQTGLLNADIANNEAFITFVSTTTTFRGLFFCFAYRII